jgi:3-hydroxymyristoyl/3-hydroxydecanoyl-(acyl carrier protein) dehydratase
VASIIAETCDMPREKHQAGEKRHRRSRHRQPRLSRYRFRRSEARVPLTSTIFEGHFPGHPLMPGVLLTQTAGWLVIAVTHFRRMPFLAAVKEAKLRTFVTPGQLLSVDAELVHEG